MGPIDEAEWTATWHHDIPEFFLLALCVGSCDVNSLEQPNLSSLAGQCSTAGLHLSSIWSLTLSVCSTGRLYEDSTLGVVVQHSPRRIQEHTARLRQVWFGGVT
jgi:hypothetical protein